jgi:hypothetical protein
MPGRIHGTFSAPRISIKFRVVKHFHVKENQVMSNYLGNSTAFEKAIDRPGMLHFRSAELNRLVDRIKEYIGAKTNDNLESVAGAWDLWESTNPKEFENRRPTDFPTELLDVADSGQTFEQSFPTPPTVVQNPLQGTHGGGVDQYRTLMKGGKAGLTLTSKGADLTQHILATPGTVGIVAAGAAVGATGIGLAAVGGAASVAGTVLAVKSVRSTRRHIKGLQDLYDHRDATQCDDKHEHEIVANHVLPYIIYQKGKKLDRKITAAIPLVQALESIRAVAKKGYKKWGTKNLGEDRKKAAGWLAAHFIHHCELALDIVEELCGLEEGEKMLELKYEEVTELLMRKMQST